MERKVIRLILGSIPLMLLWFLFYEKLPAIVSFWEFFGLDITKEYDFFAFVAFEQKIRWYIHYTSYYYALSVLAWSLWRACQFSFPATKILQLFYYLCLFRGIEYWLFRFHLGFSFICAGVIIFSLFIKKKDG